MRRRGAKSEEQWHNRGESMVVAGILVLGAVSEVTLEPRGADEKICSMLRMCVKGNSSTSRSIQVLK